jgi:hypothetical protein
MSYDRNSFYLDLEQGLYVLRTHFEMSQQDPDNEPGEWAKFFLKWAENASKYCGPWSREVLGRARTLAAKSERSGMGNSLTELDEAMSEADRRLAGEIMATLRTNHASLRSENA